MKAPFGFLAAHSSGGTAPSIVGLNYNLGDTLGGGKRLVIEVDDSTGAVSAALDGVNLGSFAIDDGTHVSGLPPARAAGSVDATVTNGNGTSAPLVGAYEYWDPTVPNATTAFFDRGGYALATILSNPNIGQWTKRAGTLDVEMVAANAGASPAISADGAPDYNRANTDALSFRRASDHAGGVTLEQLIGGSTPASDNATWFSVLDVDSINSSAGTVYKGDGIIYDNSTNRGGLVLDTTPVARWFWYQGTFQSVQLPCPSSGKFAVLMRRTAGGSPVNEITLDGVTWGTTATGAVSGASDTLSGTNPNDGTGIFDGRLRACGFTKAAWSSGNVTKFFKWVSSRHP